MDYRNERAKGNSPPLVKVEQAAKIKGKKFKKRRKYQKLVKRRACK